MPDDIKTASVLAFERKLDPSDAVFFGGDWSTRDLSDDWAAVAIRVKSVRGTISNRLKAKEQDPAKLDAAIENPNLQTVDVAALPLSADTLKTRFTLRILAGVGQPSACNDDGYRQRLASTVSGYIKEHGLGELAGRYAANLANGRFLWRNRVGAEQIEIRIDHLKDGRPAAEWSFDALAHSMPELRASAGDVGKLTELAKLVEAGLNGGAHVLLRVTAFVRVGAGQEVFPSQELILDRGRGDKSKTLYSVGDGANAAAAIHSQKIGNALRTVDTWYSDSDDAAPIAVEPYGSVTTQGKAYRQPRQKNDFYSLLDAWVLKDKVPPVPQQHFVVATLIRGGVFGESN